MLLLATRLGIRAGDIVEMTFDDLDFETGSIQITQHKTGVFIELPMLPVVQDALLDYIQNARGRSSSPYVFLSVHPPYSNISGAEFGRIVRQAIKGAGIVPRHRRSGPHAMRSSLASSMINDGIPYAIVRRILGHTGVNAIKNYARLDMEQLELYTLEPPEASGNFAEYLSGRRSVK